MSLEALAEAIQVDSSDIVRTLFMKGIMLSLNQVGGGAAAGKGVCVGRRLCPSLGSYYEFFVVIIVSLSLSELPLPLVCEGHHVKPQQGGGLHWQVAVIAHVCPRLRSVA